MERHFTSALYTEDQDKVGSFSQGGNKVVLVSTRLVSSSFFATRTVQGRPMHRTSHFAFPFIHWNNIEKWEEEEEFEEEREEREANEKLKGNSQL